MHEAAEKGDIEGVKLLIDEHGLNKNAKDNYGATLLHYAARYGHPDVIRRLIDEHGLDKNAKTKAGNTAMDLAIINGQCDTIKALNKLGVAISTKHFFTAVENRIVAIELLAQLKGDPDQLGKWKGRRVSLPPLHVAVILKKTKAIEALIAAGANPNKLNSDSDRSPLIQAVIGESLEYTPACQGDPDIIRTLVKKGALLDRAVGSDKLTALHYVAKGGNAGLTKLLLALGAKTEIKGQPWMHRPATGHCQQAKRDSKSACQKQSAGELPE